MRASITSSSCVARPAGTCSRRSVGSKRCDHIGPAQSSRVRARARRALGDASDRWRHQRRIRAPLGRPAERLSQDPRPRSARDLRRGGARLGVSASGTRAAHPGGARGVAQRPGPPFLLLEFIRSAPLRPGFHEQLGRGLADLHRFGAPSFGFTDSNFIGRLVQENRPARELGRFFITRSASSRSCARPRLPDTRRSRCDASSSNSSRSCPSS